MSEYSFAVECLPETIPEMFPLYAEHYSEMKVRLEADGLTVAPFKPRIDEYVKAWQADGLLHYVIRLDGAPVGYSNIYLTNDMHTSEFIAQEDTIFVTKPHRNGIGMKFVKFILSDLARRGTKSVRVTPVTDLRVAKIWERMGFKPVAQVMIYRFEGN